MEFGLAPLAQFVKSQLNFEPRTHPSSNINFQDHPNIVRLEEVYESHSEIYLVQEVCKGGELFDRLDEQPDYHYTEAQCARLVKQMLSSVRYIHNKGIIHR